MLKRLRKIKNNAVLLFHGLIFGLKDADNKMMHQISNKKYDDTQQEQKKQISGVFADMLEQKQTQQVKELRDSYYRIFRESDKYIVSAEYDEDVDEYRATARKKNSSFYEKHVAVDESDNLPIKLIQFNYQTNDGIMENMEQSTFDNNETLNKYLFEIDRDGITPRFKIEKYIKKIVLKKTKKQSKYVMDIYCSIYPRQFHKVDALFINEMRRIMDKKLFTNDIVYFNTFSFTTYKAYNIDDMYQFKLNNFSLKDMFIYDGNFVLRYETNTLIDGLDLTEKYKTIEMDKKYDEKSPKSNTITLDVAEKMFNNVDFNMKK